ncbi:hypothetical protein MJO52_09270 [Microbulbifer variabilis]|uniref:Uncharacterized protein n=1 Tax=Microbulbifer variabilis TaxID=266805 RepID=A0ABY4VGA0_9GAMM|nr:hypothetical protein [Microbulbifer variabilis]USD23308.1 hypothetical protein MJO52_09270 [Microbulbifer variabilis]
MIEDFEFSRREVNPKDYPFQVELPSAIFEWLIYLNSKFGNPELEKVIVQRILSTNFFEEEL